MTSEHNIFNIPIQLVVRTSLAFIVCSALLLLCTDKGNPVDDDPESTQRFLPEGLYGKMQTAENKSAVGVTVILLRENPDIDSGSPVLWEIIDTTYTDSNGYYSFADLSEGTYALFGSDDENETMVLIDSIFYPGGDSVKRVSPAMLVAGGSITGTLSLSASDNSGTTVSLYGALLNSSTDSAGRFSISGIPAGEYTLHYRKEGYLSTFKKSIVVVSAETTIVETVLMEYNPDGNPPAPNVLTLVYDTLYGVVHLRWNRVPVSDLKGYIIYRSDSMTTDPEKINKSLITDTTFIDTLFTNPRSTDTLFTIYRVKAQDDDVNYSSAFSPYAKVTAVGPGHVTTFIHLETTGTENDTASIGDTILFLATFNNPGRTLDALFWYNDSADTIRTKTIDDSTGTDTIIINSQESGTNWFTLSIRDDAGIIWSASKPVTFITDPPELTLERNRMGSQGKPVSFSVSAAQRFGSFVMYKWDFTGGGTWDDSSSTDSTTTHTYMSDNTYTAYLLVRDDDGNETIDSIKVEIGNQPPMIIDHNPDTLVSINDTVHYRCIASDADGEVVMYLWDFNANGIYDDSSTSGYTRHVFTEVNVYKTVVTARDNFGRTIRDSMEIEVIADSPQFTPFKDTTVVRNKAVSFNMQVSQQFGTIVSYEWDIDFTGDTSVDYTADSAALTHTYTSIGTYSVLCRVTDDDSNKTVATFQVTVISGLPQVTGPEDVTVSINDPISVYATGWDTLGTISGWELVIDGGTAISWSGADTTITAPSIANSSYRVIITAADDDDNTASDTMLCTVLQDAPEVELFFPDTVFVDSVNEGYVTIRQDYGTIDSIEWRINNTIIETDTESISYSSAELGTFKITVIINDDDGNVVSEEKSIVVVSGISGIFDSVFTFQKKASPYVIAGITIFNDSVKVEEGVTIIFKYNSANCKKTIEFNGTINDSIYIHNCDFTVGYDAQVYFNASYCHFDGTGNFFEADISSFTDFILTHSTMKGFSRLWICRPKKNAVIQFNTFSNFNQIAFEFIDDESYVCSDNDFSALGSGPLFDISLYYSTFSITNNNFFASAQTLLDYNYCDGGVLDFSNNYVFGITDPSALSILNDPGLPCNNIGILLGNPITR